MKLQFFLLIIISACIRLSAQIELKGKIVEETNGNPLSFASVFLKNHVLTGCVSNDQGNFVLNLNPSQITDTCIISFIGFQENRIPVISLLDKDNIIKMQESDIQIEETVIRGKQLIAEEFTLEKIDKMDIYLNPLSKADPLLAINGLASSTTIDESANISLRGSSPNETGIFFNNVPVYDAVKFSQINGIGTFSIFNTAIVKEMLVFPGNPPLEFGGATSGLVSIQTENNISNIIPEYNLSLGMANIGGLTTFLPSQKTAVTIFSNYQPSAILIGMNQDSFRDLKDFTTIDLGINFIQTIGRSSKLKVFNYSLKEGFEFELRHPSYNGIFTQNKDRNFTIANWNKSYRNGEFSINTGSSFSEEKYNYGNTNILIDKQDLYFSLNNLYFIHDFSLKTGISGDMRQSQIKGSFPVYDFAIASEHPSFTLKEKENLTVFEMYIYGKYKISEKIITGVGIRKNVPDKRQKNYLSWQGNLNLHPWQNNEITIAAGKYNKYELQNAKFDSLPLNRSRQFSIDYKLTGKTLEMVMSTFIKEVEINYIKKEIYGLEFFIKNKLFDVLEVQSSYTFINSKYKNQEVNSIPDEYDLAYYLRGSIKYTGLSQTSISMIALYRQGKCYLPVESGLINDYLNVYEPVYFRIDHYKRLKDYCKIDLSISRIFYLKEIYAIIGYLSISNILNTKNVREVNYNHNYSASFDEYFSKRSIYAGIMLQF